VVARLVQDCPIQARRITNNPDCDAVAEYPEALERAAR
jgi:hypothetical protein